MEEDELLTTDEIEKRVNKKLKKVKELVLSEDNRLGTHCLQRIPAGWVCNRMAGHKGYHVAVNSGDLLIVWNEGSLDV